MTGTARLRIGAVLAATLAICACTRRAPDPVAPIERVAASYVELADALALQDARSASLDAQAGPASARHRPTLALPDIARRARVSVEELDGLSGAPDTERRAWLRAQLHAIELRARQQADAPIGVSDEFTGLYGLDAPAVGSDANRVTLHAVRASPSDPLDAVRATLRQLLPGSGTPSARLDAYEASVTVPGPRLSAVFERALGECRQRTRSRMHLPEREHVTVKYVVGEPWSGFSAYLGDETSEISVNTSFPLTVDRVLQLACHEGYPGHHVINLLRDHARGTRPELAAVPLFSPEAFATEVIASQAMHLVFTDEERVAFERDVLCPLAGLPPGEAERHVRIAQLVEQLGPSIGEAVEHFLTGERGFVETAWALQRDAYMQHPQATIEFARSYRGVALAYTGRTPADASPGGRWLPQAGYPAGPVIMTSDGHHSSAGSQGR